MSSEHIQQGKKEPFFDRFFRIIRNEISDLSYVEIVTAVGDTKTDLKPDAEDVIIGVKETNLTILARTRIELDGDIMVLLPGLENSGDKPKINREIIEIHDKNVDVAVKNWNLFINNIFNALSLLMSVTGLTKEQVKLNFDGLVSTGNTANPTGNTANPTGNTANPTGNTANPTGNTANIKN